ncbi:hypothetical protein CK516_38955 [Nostoc sp. 'Peltigera malacea cyanobiont' DB3992]|nr:hypothetical protein CK516_38955 [Nostoc sp. 'Peltigera malacea cyanobiont' DB3992]
MLGTLCVIDQAPKELSQKQVEALVALSRLVIDQLELRRHVAEVSQVSEKLMAHEQAARSQSEAARIRIANLLESITDGFFALDKKWQFTYINGQAERLLQKARISFWVKTSGRYFQKSSAQHFIVSITEQF